MHHAPTNSYTAYLQRIISLQFKIIIVPCSCYFSSFSSCLLLVVSAIIIIIISQLVLFGWRLWDLEYKTSFFDVNKINTRLYVEVQQQASSDLHTRMSTLPVGVTVTADNSDNADIPTCHNTLTIDILNT